MHLELHIYVRNTHMYTLKYPQTHKYARIIYVYICMCACLYTIRVYMCTDRTGRLMHDHASDKLRGELRTRTRFFFYCEH